MALDDGGRETLSVTLTYVFNIALDDGGRETLSVTLAYVLT